MYSMKRSLSGPEFSSHISTAHRGISNDKQGASSRRNTVIHAGVVSTRVGWWRNPGVVACIPVCISILGIVGCGGVVKQTTSSSSGNAAKLTATPASIDFGTVNVGSSANQKVTISNTGSDSAQIAQLVLSDAAFSVDGEESSPSLWKQARPSV